MSQPTTEQQTAAIAAVYTALREAQATREPTFREKSAEDRAAYKREAKRRDRARAKAAAEAGRPEASDEAIRVALSDAALLLLAVGGPGADAIEAALRKAFPGRCAVASTTRMRARAGELKPRVLTKERLTATA